MNKPNFYSLRTTIEIEESKELSKVYNVFSNKYK